ncbi:RNA-binding domain-containing protein [Ramaria rubella]|nr:RNA-binding domain-containing protein [Ramaria rubella]
MADVASLPKPVANDVPADDEVPAGEPVRSYLYAWLAKSNLIQDETLEAMKARVEQMEREAAQLRDMQAGGYTHAASPTPAAAATTGTATVQEGDAMETEEEKEAADMRSVYVGNVDYGATPEEIQAHFQSCGTINRVTILCDKFTGHPKGYAYVEFAEPTHVQHAVVLNDSMFRGRLIKALIVVEVVVVVATEEDTEGEGTDTSRTVHGEVSEPTPSLLKGKGLMAHLYKTLPVEGTQKLLTTLFSRRHPDRLLPGSVVTVTSTHAPTTFTGVLLAIRRRGPATSFLLRNVIQRTGVEMQFFVNSPHLKDIQVIQKAGGGGGKEGKRMRRAKLYYLRHSPEKMSQISASMRG